MTNYFFIVTLIFYSIPSIAQENVIYTSIKDALKNPEKVYRLDLSGTDNLDKILPKMDVFKNLEHLDLFYCEITEFPLSILNCQHLKTINLSSNNLTILPESISKLRELEELNLATNHLQSIPSLIGNCSKLKVLNLSENFEIEEIPSSIKSLKALKKFTCKVNETDFNNIICELTSLTDLTIYTDSLYSICRLNQLQSLTNFKCLLEQPEFDSFDCSFHSLNQLKKFTLETNDCCWPYIYVSDEIWKNIQQSLPENCRFIGVRKNAGYEPLSDPNLR